MKVYIPRRIAEEGLDYLRERGYEVKLGSAQDEETMIREIADCDAVIIRLDKLTAAVIDAAPKLKVIGRHGVGLDNIDVEHATQKGIWVTNGPLSNAGAVAEHTVMLMLCCARRTYGFNSLEPKEAFQTHQHNLGTEIFGKTLGIVGYGRIGRTVANIARLGFGMDVIATTPHIMDKPKEEGVRFTPDPMEVYEQADFVSLHMPATRETSRIVGKAELGRMKPGAYLINTAREELVDREALLFALAEGKIAGAGLDFCAEPEEMDYLKALIDTGRALVTPHSGSMTKDAMAKMAVHAAMGVHEVLSGGTPTWPVNRPVL